MNWGEGLVRFTVRPPGGQGQPYGDDVVAQARALVEETRLTQKEIGARIGVSHMTVSRWARSGGWQRPPGCARPFDETGESLGAMQRYVARTRPWRLLKAAEGLLAEPAPDHDELEQAFALLLEARERHARGVGPKRSGLAGHSLPSGRGRALAAARAG